MTTRRKNAPGGRQIRHVVLVTPDEEKVLQDKASQAGISVARLLAETALGTTPEVARRVWTNELLGVRRSLSNLANTKVLPDDEWKNITFRIDKFLEDAR